MAGTHEPAPVSVIVVMGVSGAGKSTVARRLASRLGWDFEEGDALHSASNLAKMAAGEALTDADRAPWLAAVVSWIDTELAASRHGVITCSALKRSYRDQLRRPGVLFLLLDVPRPELERRVTHRHGHFMPASLLDSQLQALEPPAGDEDAVTVQSGAEGVDAVVARVLPIVDARRAGSDD